MGCSSSKPAAAESKQIALGPLPDAAPAELGQSPAPLVQTHSQPGAAPTAPIASATPAEPEAAALAATKCECTPAQQGAVDTPPLRKSLLGGIADRLLNTATGKTLAQQMDIALASSDDSRMNSILDSAMAASALDRHAPESIRRAANRIAIRQLNEAIASENPKQLKGALVAARRLHATEVPEFVKAVEKYKVVRKLPLGWDVSKMVLNRQGNKMVAKLDVSDAILHAKFQQLLDLTSREIYTRDRKGQPVPKRLELVSVTAITNDDLWGDYLVCRETVRRELEADTSDFLKYDVVTMKSHEVGADPPGDVASTEGLAEISTSLAADFGEAMLDGVNEVFLFHGTNEAAADGITTGKFKVDMAGSNTGTMYGRGIYFAENCTKADEYTRLSDSDERFLLVCRVILGRVFYTDAKKTDPRKCESVCLRSKYHSVLGDRRKCSGTFREFIVFDEDQVYANYILRYKRQLRGSEPDPAVYRLMEDMDSQLLDEDS